MVWEHLASRYIAFLYILFLKSLVCYCTSSVKFVQFRDQVLLAIRKVDKVIFFYKEIKVTKQLNSTKICGVLSTQSFEKAPRIHWFSRLFSKQTWKAPANEFVFNHLYVFFITTELHGTEINILCYHQTVQLAIVIMCWTTNITSKNESGCTGAVLEAKCCSETNHQWW